MVQVKDQLAKLGEYTTPFVQKIGNESPLQAASLKVLQINVGKKCNQTCMHCHVDASPLRTEMMTRETIDLCLQALDQHPGFETVDITGGAPEIHDDFRYLVLEIKKRGKHIIDRCNLTILEAKGFDYLYEFLKDNAVEIIASLPHFSAITTDKQRGAGVFNTSIIALKKLNAFGYGYSLPLNLVYNPNGYFLSAPQKQLEREFKEKLQENFGIIFNHLYCINNMPINRLLQSLIRRDKFQDYMDTLANAFNLATLSELMCKHQISVGYDGQLYDCDFNQMLEMHMMPIKHIGDFSVEKILGRNIMIHNHCFGCTAGSGSSCGGEIIEQQ